MLEMMETAEAQLHNQIRQKPPRLVRRNLAFGQSRNVVQVHHNQGLRINTLVRHDFFHVLLRRPSWQSLLGLLAVWSLFIIVFALLYVGVDSNQSNKSCILGSAEIPIPFRGAFAFSLQTCTTVGYTLPLPSNAFFENCPWLQLVIYLQMVVSMLCNALILSFLFMKLATSDKRAVQVLFSDKAIVSLVDGQVRLQCRVYDTDARHPVVEAHVRLYCVMNEMVVPRRLRILQPNDDLGGMLFLSFPTVVAHDIDLYSVLHPSMPDNPLRSHGLVLRQADAATATREEVACPICAEGYATHERLVNHIRFLQFMEQQENYPIKGTHRSLTNEDLQTNTYAPIQNINQLKEYFNEEISEVIAIVEGIDPLVSGTFQALHSYRMEDIVWETNAVFCPCVRVKGGDFIVDLDRFHQVNISTTTTTSSSSSSSGNNQQRSLRTHDSVLLDHEGTSKLPAAQPEPNGNGATL
jgi:hypothetical protein